MRVNNKDNEVAVEWNGMWLDHMAFRSMAQWSKIGINSSHKCHLKRHHLPPISNHPPRLCADMNSRDNLTTAPIHHSLPLQRLCPQATAAPAQLPRDAPTFSAALISTREFTSLRVWIAIWSSTRPLLLVHPLSNPQIQLSLYITLSPIQKGILKLLKPICQECVIVCVVVGEEAEEVLIVPITLQFLIPLLL